MPTGEEQEAYLRDMLDPSNREHADLLVEFTEKREEFSGEEQGLVENQLEMEELLFKGDILIIRDIYSMYVGRL